EYVELTVQFSDGETVIFEVEKEYDEPLGLMFAADVFDGIKNCANHCLFCFIDQLQPHPRSALLVKDDDYRMSFLEGNFITATNLRERDYQRIAQLRLSPLYVSVHATDPDLRKKLLGFPGDCPALPVLKRLIACGCQLHTQIVVCPDLNDGAALAKTIDDLQALYPGVQSAAIVPVGLTKFQQNPRLRLYSPQEAAALIQWVETVQVQCHHKFGTNFVFAADELYVKAGMAFPPAAAYEEFAQIENGIGMAALFLADWAALAPTLPDQVFLPSKTALVTGVNGAAVLNPLGERLTALTQGALTMIVVENDFYGKDVTATGLLTGTCLLTAIPSGVYQRLLIPANMLKFETELFLDDLTVTEVAQKLNLEITVVPPQAAALMEAICGG
ncbi:MAG: DUF512 domain-containing protein, partial [Clostridiales bacterium]